MLSILIFLPLLGGVIATLVPRGSEEGGLRAGFVSLLFAVATLGITIGLIADFDSGFLNVTQLTPSNLQHVTDVTWISQLGIHYKLGIDGLSLFMVALTALLWVGATAWSMFRPWPRPRNYYLMLALGETASLGAFCAQDLALFVLFFDLPLYPDAAVHFQELLLVIALASVLYGSVMAFTQTSATLVVAYSSIAQLGFITLGIFSLRTEGAQGA